MSRNCGIHKAVTTNKTFHLKRKESEPVDALVRNPNSLNGMVAMKLTVVYEW